MVQATWSSDSNATSISQPGLRPDGWAGSGRAARPMKRLSVAQQRRALRKRPRRWCKFELQHEPAVKQSQFTASAPVP